MVDCAEGLRARADERIRRFFLKAQQARLPVSGSLELTQRCNLRCVHCYLGPQQARRQQKPELATGQLLAIVDEIAAAGCIYLLLTGGDPLLRRDFADVYRRAKLNGLVVTVFTNGTLISDEVLALFADLPPRDVEITIYGATAETYERITGVPGSFRRCLEGISRLADRGIPLGLKTVLMASNRHEFTAMEEIARSYGARFRFDAAIFPRLDGNGTPLAARIDAAEAVQLEFADAERREGWRTFYSQYENAPLSDRVFQCGAGMSTFHVDAFGNLQPCLLAQGIRYSLPAGTFAEGWQSLGQIRMQKASDDNVCASCTRRILCGYCPAFFALENGNEEHRSEYLCALGQYRYQAIMDHSQREE